MKKRFLPLLMVAAAAAALCSHPDPARAQGNFTDVNIDYNGGQLIQNVHVATIFWGSEWKGSRYQDFLNGFFQALFTDGRYLANLAQYSANGYKISNGKYVGTFLDDLPLAATVSDSEIRAEIKALATAGSVPATDANILYFVFTPKNTVVTDRQGNSSLFDFAGYHDFASEAGFAYAVIPYDVTDNLTLAASHELAEAVTDPAPTRYTLAWYDEQYGEIGDIPVDMFYAGVIGQDGFTDTLTAADGTNYVVQKVWSNYDYAPVAFAN